tara:strand:+ start:342 stop:449 length:108 start_codon:yes stop_codon:yes gene_type:complete
MELPPPSEEDKKFRMERNRARALAVLAEKANSQHE